MRPIEKKRGWSYKSFFSLKIVSTLMLLTALLNIYHIHKIYIFFLHSAVYIACLFNAVYSLI